MGMKFSKDNALCFYFDNNIKEINNDVPSPNSSAWVFLVIIDLCLKDLVCTRVHHSLLMHTCMHEWMACLSEAREHLFHKSCMHSKKEHWKYS